MNLTRHPRPFLFPDTLQACGELAQLSERALQILFGPLAPGDVFAYSKGRAIRQFDHGPCCINHPPILGSGFEVDPLAPRRGSEIQNRLAIPQVGITFGYDIEVLLLYLFQPPTQGPLPFPIDQLETAILSRQVAHGWNMV